MLNEKKVEHIELFYDLIFVYCISKLTALLAPMTEHFTDFSPLPVYFVLFLTLLQIWTFTTFLINRYGYRHMADYLCIFVNMFFLFYMADGIRDGWGGSTFLRFHVAWVLILLNLGIQFAWKLHKHECMDGLDEKIIRRYMAILFTESLLAALTIPLYLKTGIDLTVVPLTAGAVMTALSNKLFSRRPVAFGHLAERVSLLIVVTFGEMVVAISRYFTASAEPYFGFVVFLIVFGMFLIYLFDYYNYRDESVQTAGIGYVVLNIPLIFGINNATMALEAMPESTSGTWPETVYLILSLAVFLASFRGLALYHKPEFRGRETNKRYLQMAVSALLVLLGAAMLLLHAQPRICAALAVVLVYGVLALRWLFFRANTKEQRIAAFCEIRPRYDE